MRSLRPPANWPRGTVLALQHQSSVLKDNPWRDPAERIVHVYLPPGYDETAPHVALWDLAAFTSAGPGHLNWRSHGENLIQRLNRLIGQGAMPAVVVVIPDCYTSLGGNQYLNSAAVGRYADYVVEELLPFVARRVHVHARRDGRGVFGKSSGGYGALHFAMHYPQHWGAAASHSGDVGFDWVYRPHLPETCSVLAEHGGDVLRFLQAFWSSNCPSNREQLTLLILAMAASYDPDTETPERIRLPVDLHTCSLDEQRWACWLKHDPLNQVDHAVEALKSLHALYLDVGRRDQHNVQFGTRALVRKLTRLGVGHRFEEFDGTHSAIDWRLDHSLPYLSHALKSAVAAAN